MQVWLLFDATGEREQKNAIRQIYVKTTQT